MGFGTAASVAAHPWSRDRARAPGAARQDQPNRAGRGLTQCGVRPKPLPTYRIGGEGSLEMKVAKRFRLVAHLLDPNAARPFRDHTVDDIARDALRLNLNRPFDLVFKVRQWTLCVARYQVLEPSLVELRDIGLGSSRHGVFAQELQIPARGDGLGRKN